MGKRGLREVGATRSDRGHKDTRTEKSNGQSKRLCHNGRLRASPDVSDEGEERNGAAPIDQEGRLQSCLPGLYHRPEHLKLRLALSPEPFKV
jgi:hypothetical protein